MAIKYSEKLKDPRWQKKRLEILQRDDFTCQLCNDKSTELHVHHISYKGNPWDTDNGNLITYCKYCHLVAEAINDFSDSVILYKVKRIDIDSGVHILALAWDEEYKWAIFYNYRDGQLNYLHAISDNIVAHLFKEFYP